MKFKTGLTALCLAVAAFAGCILLVFFFQPFYYAQIEGLNIVAESGLTREVIAENYRAVMHFFNPLAFAAFALPSLPYTPDGAQHFVEVKYITDTLFWVGVPAAIVGAFLWLRQKRLRAKSLIYASVGGLSVMAAIGLPLLVAFDSMFVVYHQLIFRNDLWLLDIEKDPIVTILPEAFFYNAAMAIVALLAVCFGGMLVAGLALKKKKKRRRKSRKPSARQRRQSADVR